MPDNERLNTFLHDRRISTKDLATKLGLSHSAVSLMKSGRNQMSAQTLAKMLDLFPDLCPRWLINSKGPQTCSLGEGMKTEQSDKSKDDEIALLKELLASKNEVIALLKKQKP